MGLHFAYLFLNLIGFTSVDSPCEQISRRIYQTSRIIEMYEGETRFGVHWLEPNELENYRVEIRDGKLFSAKTGEPIDTSEATDGYAIFVMDEFGNFYTYNFDRHNDFKHSSFMRDAAAAGLWKVLNGELQKADNESGHFKQSEFFLRQALSELQSRGVDIEGKFQIFNGSNYLRFVATDRLMHAVRHYEWMAP